MACDVNLPHDAHCMSGGREHTHLRAIRGEIERGYGARHGGGGDGVESGDPVTRTAIGVQSPIETDAKSHRPISTDNGSETHGRVSSLLVATFIVNNQTFSHPQT